MKITNDANTTIIGSNTTVIVPNSEELFKEQIGKIESNKPIIVKE